MYYLLKTEPDQYSYGNLERDHETVWDGVTNPTAVKHLREMKHGDHLVIYHTGGERQAVGKATVVKVTVDDPKKPEVRIKAAGAISTVKSLAEVKAESLFKTSPLVSQGRLSVVPLTEEQYHWLVQSH